MPCRDAPSQRRAARGWRPLPGVCAAGGTSPAFVIRKKALRVFTLDEYVASGILRAAYAAVIRDAVQQRQNIVIAGSTGSGKTTLLNAVLALIAETGDRLVTIEDTPELQCTAPNHLPLYT